MPGRGPAPKKPQNRTNRHTPTRGEWRTLPADPYKGPKPTLPRLAGGMLASTKDAWAIWWASPMAHMWTKSDWPILLRLVVMTDRVSRALNTGEMFTGLASMVTEVRYLEDKLGLTEKGRRDLRWELPGEDDTDDRRQHMAVVKDLPARARRDPRKLT